MKGIYFVSQIPLIIWNMYYGERIGVITIDKLLETLYSLIFINLKLN